MKTTIKPQTIKALIQAKKDLILFLKEAKLNFSLDFSLRLIPNIKKPEPHLYALLFRDHDIKNSLTEQLDSKDVEALLSQFHERTEGKSPFKLTYKKVKYDDKVWTCIYIDIVEQKEKTVSTQ